MGALRIDIGELSPAKRQANGQLVVEGMLTRAGVFTYMNPDGTARRELRPPEEVFRSDALASFAMVPVTDDHPSELLSPATARKHAVGAVGENIRRDEDYVRARLTVFDASTIEKMEAGKVALSCGYEVDLDETPGNHPQYGKYDAVQRNIRGNHVAIVDRGRAGDAARVRMDAAIQVPSQEAKESIVNEKDIAILKAALDESQAKLVTETARADKAEAALETANKQVTALEQARADANPEKLQASIAELNDKLAATEKARLDAADPVRFAAAVKRRVKIEGAAKDILGNANFDEYTDRQLMAAVVAKTPVIGGDVPASASDDYVASRFDSCVAMHAAGEKAKSALREIGRSTRREDAEKQDYRSAREKFLDEMKQMGTRPLNEGVK